MREEVLRRVLLVQAVEEADAEGTLLPPADRAAAGREAMRSVGSPDPERLLDARAQALVQRLVARHPFVADFLGMLAPSRARTVWLIAAAFLLGAAMPVLDGSHRINLLAFPFLGVVAWNFAVYAASVPWILRRTPRGETIFRAGLATTGSWLATRVVERSRAYNAPLAMALNAFARGWLDASRPLHLTRAARGLHLAAAALGAGLVASLYVRGVAFDYRAGWESTFLDAESVRALLVAIYGPASWLTGIPIPDAAALEAARREGTSGGVPAAPWIHLIAATMALYVVVPRLLLALEAAMRARRLEADMPLPAFLPAYFRRAFAHVEGAVERARAIVMPFACELTPGALARLVAWVQGAAGGPVDVSARDSLPYGEEERYLETFGERGGDTADLVVLPFGLAATPEAENHGVVLAGVRDRIGKRPGARLLVVVDEAPYAERMAAAPQRIDERRGAWRDFVRAHGLEAQFVRLDEPPGRTP